MTAVGAPPCAISRFGIRCAITTNASAIVAFAITGNILWGLGLAMGVANLTGGYLGARTALTRGNAFIRKVFLLVVGALAIKLAWDTFFTYWG